MAHHPPGRPGRTGRRKRVAMATLIAAQLPIHRCDTTVVADVENIGLSCSCNIILLQVLQEIGIAQTSSASRKKSQAQGATTTK